MSRVLLLIDDAEELCLVLERALRKHFDAVHTATSSAGASSILQAEPVTHVVCDLFLGDEEPLGHELIRGWRARKPEIRYVALFTGSHLDHPPARAGIDDVFPKPRGLFRLLEVLKEQPRDD